MRKLGLVSVALFLAACGGASVEARAPSEPSAGAVAVASESAGPTAAGYATPASPPPSPSPAKSSAPAATDDSKDDSSSRASEPLAVAGPESPRRGGLLTAGVWDDAKNFDFFLGYASKLRARGSDFDMFAKSELSAARAAADARLAHPKPKHELDVQIIFDTTGSMGDELSYVQSEIDSIAARLRERMPEVRPRWSLIFYRDKGDEYVTRPFAFSADTALVRRALAAQSAGGGGDYPEAVIAGLTAAAAQPWREQDDVAKVAFWIADAPSHDGEGQAFGEVVRRIAKKGVHVYPIAASGADELTELEMRSAALMTGGRYMFLTDDSGVGGSHAEPHIPCYAVTKLDRAIVRMLEIEVKGQHIPTPSNDVLRAVGSPSADGSCKLASGDLVAAF